MWSLQLSAASHGIRSVRADPRAERHHHRQPRIAATSHPCHSNPPLGVGPAVLLLSAMALCAAKQSKGQDLISSNALPIKITGPHTFKDVEELIHCIKHHSGSGSSVFHSGGHLIFMVISGYLEVHDVLIYMVPQMLIVFHECSIEAPPKHCFECVNENQIMNLYAPITFLIKCEFNDEHVCKVHVESVRHTTGTYRADMA